MVRRIIDFLVNSDPASGSTNLSTNQDQMDVVYSNPPYRIPRNAENVQVQLLEALIWNTSPNVKLDVNDKFYIADTNNGASPSGTAKNYDITIPPGLYDLTAVYLAIATELANQGAPSLLINMTPDNATGKVIITTLFTGIEVDFNITNSIRELLGWTAVSIGPELVIAPYAFTAPNQAEFNTINSYLVHSTIVDDGLYLNAGKSQIIGAVIIDVLPGSQITYTPFNPPITDASGLRNSSRTQYRYWITDGSNNPVSMGGEYWSLRLRITYETK